MPHRFPDTVQLDLGRFLGAVQTLRTTGVFRVDQTEQEGVQTDGETC